MSLPAGGFITTRDGKRCTAVPKTIKSSSKTSTQAATTTQSSDNNNINDGNNNANNDSDDVATTTVNPAANVVLGSPTTIQDAPATTTVDPPATTEDPVIETPSDTVVPPTTTPIAEIDPAAVAAQFGVTSSTPISTPTPTETPAQSALAQAVQPDPESVTDAPIIASDTATSDSTTSDIAVVPIATTPPAADSAESDIAFPTDPVVPSSTNNQQLIAVIPTVLADTPTPTGPGSAAESATLESSSQTGKVAVGHLVGGIVGGISLIALLGCLWLYFMRRRRRRDTLTPLWVQSEKGPPVAYYEIDNASVGPTSLGSKWKAKATSRYHGVVGGFTALSSKMGHKPSPSVNLNRGNSQFLAPSFSTHSRSSSSISHPPTALTRRERARDWWDRLTADAVFNWALSRHTKPTTADPPSHFTRSRSASPSSRHQSQDLTQYLASKDREMRDAGAAAGLPADHRRSISLPPPTRSREDLGDGSLGIDFSDLGNPFSDPAPTAATRTLAPNPFADPSPAAAGVSRPQPSVGTTYVADVRRSRGQSFSTPRRASIRTSRERSRDRDTMLSSATTNTRRGKGRSDPFDLERPELLRGVSAGTRGSVLSDVQELPSSAGSSLKGGVAGGGGGMMMGAVGDGGEKVLGVGLSHESWTSRYSRGSSAGFSDWGDPGPDLGPRGGYGGVGTAM
ncbi:hypothetical protein VE01_08665 [Pseudogymnoascus verrucosus]|uniref:Mid2 domain-containing protein n=1 Tax=Pseudogymnoascus verrucosus TaxID=342668 RepID=A0A1B8GCB2_9PEZI|nr:uncharacterized protein VE01_08665 [Pseudogymnoascus verrucosus]OBT93462.1 hypothetical protein VE01_08665 [Pseudogymnoascus verrucosus]